MRGQSVTDHRNFVRFGVEQPIIEVGDLRAVHRQQGEAGVELLAGVLVCFRLAVGFVQQRVDPPAIGTHVLHDGRHFVGVGVQQSVP